MVGPPPVVRELLRLVQPPHPFVVIAQGWPSVLVSILGLGLPLKAAFFSTCFHQYFKEPLNKSGIKVFYTNSQFPPVFHKKLCITLVAGSPSFVERTLAAVHDTKRVLVSFELNLLAPRRGIEPKTLKMAWKECLKVLHKHELCSFTLRDFKCGGATDAVFLFGLGSGSGFGLLPSDNNTIERALRHFLDGGTDIPTNIPEVDLDVPGNIIWSSDKTFIPVVDLPVLDRPPRRVIWASDKIGGLSPIWNTKTFVRQERLFPTRRPQVLVACPSHY